MNHLLATTHLCDLYHARNSHATPYSTGFHVTQSSTGVFLVYIGVSARPLRTDQLWQGRASAEARPDHPSEPSIFSRCLPCCATSSIAPCLPLSPWVDESPHSTKRRRQGLLSTDIVSASDVVVQQACTLAMASQTSSPHRDFGFLPIPARLRHDPAKPVHFGIVLNVSFGFVSTFGACIMLGSILSSQLTSTQSSPIYTTANQFSVSPYVDLRAEIY